MNRREFMQTAVAAPVIAASLPHSCEYKVYAEYHDAMYCVCGNMKTGLQIAMEHDPDGLFTDYSKPLLQQDGL